MSLPSSHEPPRLPDLEIFELVGTGSYGDVWRARTATGAWRAVKVVRRSVFHSPAPFEREFAGIQAYEPVSRSHESLVQVLHVGRQEDAGLFYYVMELADPAPGSAGDPPEYQPHTIAHDLTVHGHLPAADCVRLGISLASALIHLHMAGLVHRDIKPSNVIFVGGIPKLADIGLVTEAGESRSFVGTEGFVPQEGPGTERADIYSLGKTLYEMATGLDRKRFPQLPDDWTRRPDHGQLLELNEVLLKACEADATRRHVNVSELRAELTLLDSGRSVRRARRLESSLARATRLAAVTTVAGLLALGASFWSERRAREAESQRKREESLRLRAHAAEERSQRLLAESHMARASTERRSGRSGQRFTSLAEIARAVAIVGPSPALRSEAASALALVDLQFERDEPQPPPGTQTVSDPSQTHVAQLDANRTVIRVTSRVSGIAPTVLERAGRRVTFFGGFSPDGKWFHTSYDDGETWVWDWRRSEALCRLRLGDVIRQFTQDSQELVAVQGERLVFFELGSGRTGREHLLPVPVHDLWPCPHREGFFAVTRREAGRDRAFGRLEAGGSRLAWRGSLPGDTFALSRAWSADGRWFAAGGSDFRIYLWDTFSEAPPHVLVGHDAEVVGVAFHPNGEILASTSWDGTAQLWDLVDRHRLLGHPDWLSSMRFSPDGQDLSGWIDTSGVRRVWRVVLGEVCRRLHEPTPSLDVAQSKGPWHCTFDPGGLRLAAASWDGVRVWDLATNTPPAFIPVGKCMSSGFLEDGTLLTVGGGRPRRWSGTADGPDPAWREIPMPLETLPSEATWVETGLGQNSILVSCRDSIWLASNDAFRPLVPSGVSARSVAVAPDGTRFLVIDPGRSVVELRRMDTGAVIRSFPAGRFCGGTFSQRGDRLIVIAGDEIACWDGDGTRNVWRVPWQNSGGGGGCAAFSPDDALVAVTLDPRTPALLDANSGALVVRLEHPEPQPVNWLAFSPDGAHLAVACSTHRIQLWRLSELKRQLADLGLSW